MTYLTFTHFIHSAALRLSLAAATAGLLGCQTLHSPAVESAPAPAPKVAAAPGVYDLSNLLTLGLPAAPASTHLVYRGGDDSGYNHGAVLFAFKDALYVQWQSSRRDEDAPETQTLYATSSDGVHWSAPKVLVPARKQELVTNGGWWSDGETLVAYLNVWPDGMDRSRGHVEYITSVDGVQWSAPAPLVMHDGTRVSGIIEQDPKRLPSGRVLTLLHRQPGLIATPFYTDDPLGVSGWRLGEMQNMQSLGATSRELEPSWYLAGDGHPVVVFRDQDNSHRVLASRGSPDASLWQTPYITNIPDSRAKQSAGNLPDGRAYLVNNPSGLKSRAPLAVSVSEDGYTFTDAYRLRTEADRQPMRYQGKYKRVGFSYPKSLVWRDQLWVAYATNKEDIEVTRVDLAALPVAPKNAN